MSKYHPLNIPHYNKKWYWIPKSLASECNKSYPTYLPDEIYRKLKNGTDLARVAREYDTKELALQDLEQALTTGLVP